jgi:polygalacturonase
MEFKTLCVGPFFATFELVDKTVYFSNEPYDVILDGKVVLRGVKTNVFSLYELNPDKEYEVSVGEDSQKFKTSKPSLILHVKDLINPSKEKDDTLLFQTAISLLPKNGVLYVDKGEYEVTSLFLKSDMTLYLEKGAVIKGNRNPEDYPLVPGELKYFDENQKEMQAMAWEGNPFIGKPSLINAYWAENVVIAGEGTFDGRADESTFWNDVKNLKWGRPRMFFFNNSKNIIVQGVSVKNSPCWTIHPYFCSHLGFYDLKISNPKDAPNTDGMDPECCSDVKVIGVYFSVGDDCIALKSGKMYIGSKYQVPTEHVEIRNCYMHEGHGAIVLGSEVSAGVKDIKVERCYFEHTDRGFRIKTRRGRGKTSVIDKVLFKDIVMEHVLTPLVINMFYFCDPDGKSEYVWSKEKLPIDDRTPYLGSFTFENIQARDAEYALGWFYGLPEMPIKSVTIKNSSFTVKKDADKGMPAMMSNIQECSKKGFCFFNVQQVVLENVKAEGYEGKEVETSAVSSLQIL